MLSFCGMFTDLSLSPFCFFCVYRHTLISCTMSGSNCNVFLLNAFEMLKVFLDLGHGWWILKSDQLWIDGPLDTVDGSWVSPKTRVLAWCGVQGMCSSVSLGLTYNFNSLMAKATVPSCFKTATIIPVPKVTSLTDHALIHIMMK